MKSLLSAGHRYTSIGLTLVLLGSVAAYSDSGQGLCHGTIAKDDGSVESGYGFVPSATTGTYVQAFDRSELEGPFLTSVCLCFLKTRPDQDIEFEVVVYADENGRPASEPIAVVAGSQEGVANSKETAGEFVEIGLPSIPLPTGTVYIGSRWNPSEERYLFICNDQSDAPPKTAAFFSDDRSSAWTNVLEARDPLFKNHRAIMVRPRTSAKPVKLKATASRPPERASED